MSWTSTPPGPASPGPANDVSTANPAWNQWGQGLIDLAWQTYLYSSLGAPPDPYFRITGSRTGRRIPIPIAGEDPDAWQADGGRWDGTLEVDIALLNAGTEVDFTRYRRVYSKVRFQDYQELIVSIEYGWGSCGAWHHFWFGKTDCLHRERELTFWNPVGQPYERQNVRAYRWVHTSTKKEGGVSIPVAEDTSIGVTGSGSTFIPWDPENPPPEPNPDDFHPNHGNPPGGGRNGPYTGYGAMSSHLQVGRLVERDVAIALGELTSPKEGALAPRAIAQAFLAAHISVQLVDAERLASVRVGPKDEARPKHDQSKRQK